MPSKLALCIGINDYPGTGSDLHGCVNDARDWAEELRGRGFRTEMLLDAQATGAKIRSGLRHLAEEASSGDLVVITYSAHGSFVPDLDGDEQDGYDECWCPHDIDTQGPITDDELNTIFSSRAEAVRWVVISDSCHSGTVTRYGPGMGKRSEDDARHIRFLPPAAFDARARRAEHGGMADRVVAASAPGRNSALLMSGCTDREYSWDATIDGRPRGAFTAAALRVLRSLDAKATYADWHEGVRQLLPSPTYPQSPNLYGPDAMKSWSVLRTEAEDGAGGWAEGVESNGSGDDAACREPARVGRDLAHEVLKSRKKARSQARGGDRGILLAEGDSWFDLPGADVLGCLEDRHGYDVFSDAHHGDRLEDIAYSKGHLERFARMIERLRKRNLPEPKAVLLSAGGNDVVGDSFAELLNHASSPNPGLNETIVEGVIEGRIADAYRTLVTAVTSIYQSYYGTRPRVFVHGYDYAVPDGRGFWGGWWVLPGPWMKPGFERKGYTSLTHNRAVIRTLIDRLNRMLDTLHRQDGYEHVHHVSLVDTLSGDGPEDYKRWWQDELHPTKRGFREIARTFARQIG